MQQKTSQLNATPAQVQAMSACPLQCLPRGVMQAHSFGPLGNVLSSFCRCQVCLASWKVNALGEVSELKAPMMVEYCLKCFWPAGRPYHNDKGDCLKEEN